MIMRQQWPFLLAMFAVLAVAFSGVGWLLELQGEGKQDVGRAKMQVWLAMAGLTLFVAIWIFMFLRKLLCSKGEVANYNVPLSFARFLLYLVPLAIMVLLTMIVAGMILGVLLTSVTPLLDVMVFPLVAFIGLFLCLRFSPLLAAASLGKRIKLKPAWQMTRGQAKAWVVLLAMVIAFALIAQLGLFIGPMDAVLSALFVTVFFLMTVHLYRPVSDKES